MNHKEPQKQSKLNIILLLISALASMATLAAEDSDYGPETITPFESRGLTLNLRVNPAADHVENLESLRPLSLKFTVENALRSSNSRARWTLLVKGSDQDPIIGEFTPGEQWSDEGRNYNNLIALTPRFCNTDTTTDNNCLPCDLTEGCDLELSIDVCEGLSDGYYLVTNFALEDGSTFSKVCKNENVSETCKKLETWLSSTDIALENELCVD
jgi:hypothetical protein